MNMPNYSIYNRCQKLTHKFQALLTFTVQQLSRPHKFKLASFTKQDHHKEISKVVTTKILLTKVQQCFQFITDKCHMNLLNIVNHFIITNQHQFQFQKQNIIHHFYQQIKCQASGNQLIFISISNTLKDKY